MRNGSRGANERSGAVAAPSSLNGKNDRGSGTKFVKSDNTKYDDARFHAAAHFLSDLLDEMSEGVFVWNDSGKCVEINSSAAVLLGYKREEIIGRYFLDFIHELDVNGKILKSGHALSENMNNVNVRLIGKDGSHIPVKMRQKLLNDGSIAAVVTDMRPSCIATEIGRNNNRLYATLSGINHSIVRAKDEPSLFDEACRVAVEVGGFAIAMIGLVVDEGEAVSITAWRSSDGYEPAYSTLDIARTPLNRSPLSDSIRTGRVIVNNGLVSFSGEQLPALQDRVRTFTSIASVPISKSGAVIGVLMLGRNDSQEITEKERSMLEEIGEDISFAVETIEIERERNLAQVNLANSEERFKTVADFTYDWEYWTDPDGNFIYVSPSCERITGYKPEDFMKDPNLLFKRVHKDDRKMVRCHFDDIRKMAPGSLDFRLVGRDGEIKWVNHVCQPVFGRDGIWLGSRGSNRDITARKSAEAALSASEEKLRTIMEQMNDTVIVVDSDGKLVFVSGAVEHIIGRRPEEVIGSHFADFLVEEDIEKATLHFTDIMLTGEPAKDVELRLKRNDGSIVVCEVDSAIYRAGRRNGVIGVVRDISERKEAEAEITNAQRRKKELERQLQQAQKFESLGILAGGIAHDFNNLLGIILGNSLLLLKKKPEDSRLLKGLEAIRIASQRGASLVKQLLTVARKTEMVFSPVNLNQILEEVAKLLGETFPKTIVVNKDLAPELPSVMADASQLHQVFLNLCINSRDAMPTGGKLHLLTSVIGRSSIRDKFVRVKSEKYVFVKVSDTGTGMSEETREKIFDPFFTTKSPGKGTGLGLAMVYSILETHHGLIEVESEEGKGTAFNLYFPVGNEEPDDSIPPDDGGENGEGGEETILVIEDEEMLQDIVRNTLLPEGYTVIAASDGEAGLEIFHRQMKKIDLVVVDFGLPKLDGGQVVREILAAKPSARVIVVSGFLEAESQEELSKAGVRMFVQKPYSPRQMQSAVRTVLDSDS